MNIITLKVAIVEPLPMIRAGLEALLKKITGYKIQFIDAPADNGWVDVISFYCPDVVFMNPLVSGLTRNESDKACPQSRYVGLLTMPIDSNMLHNYDDTLSVHATVEELRQLLERLYQKTLEPEESGEEQQTLTNREKEIVVGVVKGMTNKEIAEELFLSTHTVITHRRNIAKKLQIHSPSGLTIYAIMNKLVNLDEIAH